MAGRGLLGLAEIAEKQPRIAAMDGEDAGRAGRVLGPVLGQDRHPPPRLRIARRAGRRRPRGRAGEEGRALGHPHRLVEFRPRPRPPRVAQRRVEPLARGQPVPQAGDRRPVGAQDAAEDAGGGGEDRGAVARGEQRDLFERGALGRDQRGGADRPGVHQPGAEGEGPVEGARVHQPVVRCEPVPALKHHRPREDGAMRVHHRPRLARSARGIDDIGQPVRVALGERRRGQGRHRGQLGHRQDRGGVALGQGDAGAGDGQRMGDLGRDLAHLAGGQHRRGRHRHQPRRDAAEIGDRERRLVADPEQHPVAGPEPAGEQPRRRAPHRRGQATVGPAVGPRRRDDGEGELVGCGLPRGQHVRGEVQRARGGGGRRLGHGGRMILPAWRVQGAARGGGPLPPQPAPRTRRGATVVDVACAPAATAPARQPRLPARLNSAHDRVRPRPSPAADGLPRSSPAG